MQEEDDVIVSKQFRNKALNAWLEDMDINWTGDIFVAKVDAVSGTLMDVRSNDLKDIQETLKRYVVRCIDLFLVLQSHSDIQVVLLCRNSLIA